MNDSGEPQAPASEPSVSASMLRLGLLALGVAVLLSFVYKGTTALIAAQERQARLDALTAVLPPTRHNNDLLADSFMLDPTAPRFMQQELLGLSEPRSAYLTRTDGVTNGVILPLETDQGFRGPIVLLIGIDSDGVITGVRTMEHSETPGIGDHIELEHSDWILSFDNRSLANTTSPRWAVKNDDGEFDQFVGATITPRAVVNVVHQALQFFELNRDTLLALDPADYQP
jgi:electron transport complex protein RnfG